MHEEERRKVGIEVVKMGYIKKTSKIKDTQSFLRKATHLISGDSLKIINAIILICYCIT
jgi:hypothetical protein